MLSWRGEEKTHANNPESRDNLINELAPVLGEKTSVTFLDMIPDTAQLGTKADINRLEGQIGGLEGQIGGVQGQVKDLATLIDRRMERFEDKVWDLHEVIRRQARTNLVAIIGGMTGFGAIVVAVSRLT